MQLVEHALKLAESGDVRTAYNLLCEESKCGNAEASKQLAIWRIRGDLIRRDFRESRRLFGLAVEQGSIDAIANYAALLANGAGGMRRNWRAALEEIKRKGGAESKLQLDLIDSMCLDEEGEPETEYEAHRLCTSPAAWKFPAFLTKQECSFLIDLARPVLRPSVVVHPHTGELIRDPVRRSSTTSFPFINEPPALHAINRRIAKATRTTYENGEPAQILCYKPGDEYRRHSDVLPSDSNQRILTFLVYLSDDYEGGETRFPDANFAHKGKVGDALLFRNVDPFGRADMSAVHTGEPVRSGRKYLLSKWIRQKPLDLAGPLGRPF